MPLFTFQTVASSNVSIHFRVPLNTNPADFFMDTMSVDYRSPELKEKSLARVKVIQDNWKSLPEKVERKEDSSRNHCMTEWNNSFFYEFALLLKRNLEEVFRDRVGMAAIIISSVVNCIIMGGTFWQVTYKLLFISSLDQSGIQNRIGVLFMVTLNMVFNNVMPVIAVFITQREIMKRERGAGTYR